MHRRQFQQYCADLKTRFAQLPNGPERDVFYYEAGRPSYTSANPLARWLFWQRIWQVITYLDKKPPLGVVVDFGCGLGVMLPFLQSRASRILACDLSTEHLTGLYQGTKITFYQQLEAIASAYRHGINLILALDVLEHVADLEPILKIFAELLGAGGEIVISGPTENWLYKFGRWWVGYTYAGAHHVRNIYDIRRAMGNQFAVQTIATLYYPMPLFKLYAAHVRT